MTQVEGALDVLSIDDCGVLTIEPKNRAAKLFSKARNPLTCPASEVTAAYSLSDGDWGITCEGAGRRISVGFAEKHLSAFENFTARLGGVTTTPEEARRAAEVEAAARAAEREEAAARKKAEREQAARNAWRRARMSEFGVVVKGGEVRHGREGGTLAGVRATVDTAGEIDKRITATRLLLAGPFALAFRKKKDRRELYLFVEGKGFAFVVEVDPNRGVEARRFAAELTALGSKAEQSTASLPPEESLDATREPTRAGVADELKKLAELRDASVLTPEEFEAEKRKLLG